MEEKLPKVFNYICYRKYLSEFYAWHKRNTYRFSFRAMAELLGFSSPNFLKLVIDGDRNVGKESLEKICRGIAFNKLEAEYFSYLVFFSQAKDNIDKNYYYGLLSSLRSNRAITRIAPEQYEYFNEWYHPAVREMIVGKKDPLDYQTLAQALDHRISIPNLKKSVALLLRLELVKLNQESIFEITNPLLNTENELKPFAVRKYHKEVLSIAQSALDQISPDERENSHLTVSLSDEGFRKIKTRIQEFRAELLQLASEDTNVESVYHINVQLYPIAKRGNYDYIK